MPLQLQIQRCAKGNTDGVGSELKSLGTSMGSGFSGSSISLMQLERFTDIHKDAKGLRANALQNIVSRFVSAGVL